ncbi:hypothetical protein [Sphingobacterium sp. LRF_L2]|uniref:hypothetical protein n=1 Tax=Sphingobacterium sp. LRF_L2 TaxID=3369421 RepID=UPI003F5E83E7
MMALLESSQKYIEKDTMADMRQLSTSEIELLTSGGYKGVRLNGYYGLGDAPQVLYWFDVENTEQV